MEERTSGKRQVVVSCGFEVGRRQVVQEKASDEVEG